MNLDTATPTQRAIYAMCLELEKLPASELQTRLVSLFTDATLEIERLREALRKADIAINPPDKDGISMHEWGGRLRSATVGIRDMLDMLGSK